MRIDFGHQEHTGGIVELDLRREYDGAALKVEPLTILNKNVPKGFEPMLHLIVLERRQRIRHSEQEIRFLWLPLLCPLHPITSPLRNQGAVLLCSLGAVEAFEMASPWTY